MASKIDEITAERGKTYGHPLAHFNTTQTLYNHWLRQRMSRGEQNLSERQESAVRHAVYMICDKLARAVKDPTHIDNWDDIGGYAKCAKECIEIEDPESL